jgi:hypothetical protein
MLLVITPSAKARGCAHAIQQVTSEETHVAATLSQALTQLRAQEYVAVLIDQAFLEIEPAESDVGAGTYRYCHSGTRELRH